MLMRSDHDEQKFFFLSFKHTFFKKEEEDEEGKIEETQELLQLHLLINIYL